MGRKSQTKNMTNDQKKAICEYASHHPKLPQEAVARWAQSQFALASQPSQSTISKILKRKHELLVMPANDLGCKRKRRLRFPQLEKALIEWILQCKAQHIRVTGEAIKEKASRLVDELQLQVTCEPPSGTVQGDSTATTTTTSSTMKRPSFSNGWLQAFKARNGFLELGRDTARDCKDVSVDYTAAAGATSTTTTATTSGPLDGLVNGMPITADNTTIQAPDQASGTLHGMSNDLAHAETDHDAEEDTEESSTKALVFAGDLQQQPQLLLITRREEILALVSQFEPRDIYNMDETGLCYALAPSRRTGSSPDDERESDLLTLLLCVNADGSDLMPIQFIGRRARPRCFAGKSALELGLKYTSNKSSRVCESVFRQWLVQLDTQMRQKERHILLLVNNVRVHCVTNLQLSNVTVRMLCSNTVANLQPLLSGIGTALKRRYRRAFLENALDRQEGKCSDVYKVNVLQAMRWVMKCWQGLPVSLIKDSFRGLGILCQEAVNKVNNHELRIEKEIVQLMQRLQVKNAMSLKDFVTPAAENACWVSLQSESNAEREQDSVVDLLIHDQEVDTEVREEESDELEETPALSTGSSQLDSLRQVIRLAYESNECSDATIRELRHLQSELRAAFSCGFAL